MKMRIAGYLIWLATAGLLYFFENNAGSRVILVASLIIPLIPALRAAFFSGHVRKKAVMQDRVSVELPMRTEDEESGSLRLYLPGDPVSRIHWKLSAKRNQLLVRDSVRGEEVQISENQVTGQNNRERSFHFFARVFLIAAFVCIGFLFLFPSGRTGAQVLVNRLFEASERRNAYVYTYFPVDSNQNVTLALFCILTAFVCLLLSAILSGRRAAVMALYMACVVFLVYFGLAFPDWVSIVGFMCAAYPLMRFPVSWKTAGFFSGVVLAVAAVIMFIFPGVDALTESASEHVRDMLSELTQSNAAVLYETPEEEAEARHIFTQSLIEGDAAAKAKNEYRLVVVDEEQISMPRWVDYLKICLMLLLTVAVLVLPFMPFLVLNERRKKAQKRRALFTCDDPGQAVSAMFLHVIAWLLACGCDGGNRSFRSWTDVITARFGREYASRFEHCARIYEEAAYSTHMIDEGQRRSVSELLDETEATAMGEAGMKERLYFRYWMCLCE